VSETRGRPLQDWVVRVIAVVLAGCVLGCSGSSATTTGADAATHARDGASDSDAPEEIRDAIVARDAGDDGGSHDAEGACRDACTATLPADFTCEGTTDPAMLRATIIDDCTTRCVALSELVSQACADCVRGSMSPPSQDECSFSTPQIALGIFGACALGGCDVVYPCSSEDACGAESECLRPCGTGSPWGIWGVCRFPESGTCSCTAGAPSMDTCTDAAVCVCPACGDGSGICVNDAQRASLCFDYTVSPLMEATSRFVCG